MYEPKIQDVARAATILELMGRNEWLAFEEELKVKADRIAHSLPGSTGEVSTARDGGMYQAYMLIIKRLKPEMMERLQSAGKNQTAS